MTTSADNVEILAQMGLALNEARIFWVLSQNGPATAKAISKASGVAREAVYQIMPALQKKGLVEIVLTAPKMFMAIQKEYAYKIILANQREENRKLRAKVKKALITLEKTTPLPRKEDSETLIIPPGRVQFHRILKEFENCQTSIDIVVPWNGFREVRRLFVEEKPKIITKRDPRIRIITEKNGKKGRETFPTTFSSIAGLKKLDLRYIPDVPRVNMSLFDKKNLIIDTVADAPLRKTSVLWSNNPCIVEMANGYFENLWSQSMKAD